MRKGKRKGHDSRRRDSATHPSSDSNQAVNRSFGSATQPTSSDSTYQPPSMESRPQNPVLQALPAPEISRPTDCLLPLDTKPKHPAVKPGPLIPADPRSCTCIPCPGSSACCHRLGQCHCRINDVLVPGNWHPLLGRGTPSLLTFYRRSGRKHSFHRNPRAPSSRDSSCGPGGPGRCLLHH
ncbi:spermatogenesis-associated protein 3 isoform X2 [Echinops telfairi]|uniref:Spermatogenesis-associated protein 3 isoform X2 n=1 Tax=Echinops telfairi TaxID=9371 RepID=A0AC55DDK5_ECHTE|nr:spermatogenesis-associated protein 3 isoform X2 [Echinops telfairi]